MSQAGIINISGGGGGGTPVETLSDDVGTVVTPLANNIQLVGHIVEQGATKFSTVVAGTHLLNINPMSTSRWIVDHLGFNGTHTTITSAMASATSGDDIFVMPGTYTENFTITPGVNLVAYNGDGDTPNVTVNGTVTMSGAGTSTISGICLQTNSAFAIVVSGSAASILHIKNCLLNFSNNTGISFTSSNSSSFIHIEYCFGDLGTTGIAMFASSSAGELRISYSRISNSGHSTTASTISSGHLAAFYSLFFSPITTSGTSQSNIYWTEINTSSLNTTSLTIGGSGGNFALHDRFGSGSASSLSISSTLQIDNSIYNSSNGNVITGVGTLNASLLTMTGSSAGINVTTQTPNTAVVGSWKVALPVGDYSVLQYDYFIGATTSAARAITLPASPVSGELHRIKDISGTAATHNITVNGGGHNIDGAATYVIAINYGSIDVIFSGIAWFVI